MKKYAFSILFSVLASASCAQFADSTALKNYILENIKDKRPEKVTAAQIQNALLGLLRQKPAIKASNGVTITDNTIKLGDTIKEATTFTGFGPGSILWKKIQSFKIDSTPIVDVIASTRANIGTANASLNLGGISGSAELYAKSNLYLDAPYFDIGQSTNAGAYYNGIGKVRLKHYSNTKDSALTTDGSGNLKFIHLKNLENSDLTISGYRQIIGGGTLDARLSLIRFNSGSDPASLIISNNIPGVNINAWATPYTSKLWITPDRNYIHCNNNGIEVTPNDFRVVRFIGGSSFESKFSVKYNGEVTFTNNTIFADGRMTGKKATNPNEFVTLEQLSTQEQTVTFKKSVSLPLRVIRSNTTITVSDSDYTIIAGPENATVNEIVVNLPNATGIDGRIYKFILRKYEDEVSSAGTLKLTPWAGQTIEDMPDYTIESPQETVTLQAYEGRWYFVGYQP